MPPASPDNMTMAGSYGPHRHRTISIDKAENGFIVRWSLQVTKQHERNGVLVDYHEIESRTSVFYSTLETLGFVKQFLESPASDLQT